MYLTKEQEATIIWSALSEPGDALAYLVFLLRGPKALEEIRSGSAKKLWPTSIGECAPEYLSALPGLLERVSLRLPSIQIGILVERAIRWNSKPIFPEAAPALWSKFADLELHQPYLLWVAGDLSALEGLSASIVGTRNPSSQGLSNAKKLVDQLQVPVVSGGARGIDAAAHSAALGLKIPTVAFMAGGVDRAYPAENWELFHKMVRSGGALVSELAPFTAPSRFRFLQRNRLIAAASSATYVVEAGYRSGSKNTANHARSCGREVFAIPGPYGDLSSQGCNSMIREGLAKPWPLNSQFDREESLEAKRVQDAQLAGARTEVEIARESGLSLSAVRQILRTRKEGREIIPAVTKS